MKKMYTHVFFLAKKHHNHPQFLPLLIGVVLMLLPIVGKAAPMCTPSGANVDQITNFQLSNINQNSSSSSKSIDYTSKTIYLTVGIPYTVTYTVVGSGSHNAAMWIDLNDDNKEDAGERIFNDTRSSGGGTYTTASFNVPNNPGSHRLRFMWVYNTSNPALCTNVDWMQVQDYTVNIAANNPATILGSSSNVQTTYTVPTGVCKVAVECVGGGGGGGNYNSGGGWGGGGGAYSYQLIDVSSISTLYLQAGKYGINNNNADDSYVKTVSQSGTPQCLAKGGTSANLNSSFGTGGAASSGTGAITKSGGSGINSNATGGGGAGGMGGDGGSATSGKYDGGWPAYGNPATTNGYGGWGGNGVAGYTGEWYGGGGGGSGNGGSKNGGNGGNGAVLIYPYLCDAITTPITNTGADVLCSGGTTTLQANLPTGGTITNFTGNGTIGTNGVVYYVHTFTSSGDRFNTLGPISADYLMVGGGGGGGTNGGGGGGAGEYVSSSGATLNTGMYPVFVGKGGNPNNSSGTYGNKHTGFRGGVSYFNGVLANGGGGGASRDGGGAALNGGSGGGGGNAPANNPEINIGSAVPLNSGNGNAGGLGDYNSGCGTYGGGGGGAGSAGVRGNTGGTGGTGLQNNITGTNSFYAAGGGSGTCGNANIKAGGSGMVVVVMVVIMHFQLLIQVLAVVAVLVIMLVKPVQTELLLSVILKVLGVVVILVLLR